ncbi:MAG: thioredoxin domain-containing protein, partial [Alphaproteobacteria bacterium]
MSRNRLGGETSPYLLQHRDNPVHWQPWDERAFAEAKRHDKPVLLSIGYAACHWCHVMAHESFEDAQTAALMNELFVNIKVDREERPDLDAIYQTALALLGQHGGWPLTMFLTPEGEPFWGGTYFPPSGRYGRPGFQDVLRAVHKVYTSEPEKVEKNRAALVEALQALSRKEAGGAIPLALGDQVAELLLQEVDPVWGGIGGAPKFPQTMVLELLWRAYKRGAGAAMRDAVLLSARRICEGGIYDHLGGGFARYAVDERWLVPHFEKMLYDNALILELLAHLWQETGDALFKNRTEETVAWVLREMAAPDGGFASAYDADSEGEEGRFYTWSADEIDRLLGPDAAAFKAVYDVGAQGNWEGRNILHRNAAPADAAIDEAQLAAMRAVLFRARAERVPPACDDKVLADWNGL